VKRTITILLPLALLWAFPATAIGLLLGLGTLCSGGRVRRVQRTLEFRGGLGAWVLRHAPIVGGASAITLGHVILGRTQDDLDRCRSHEGVHVRQYEIWGPFFLPAYLLCSLVLFLGRRNYYFDNPFEVQARTDQQDERD